LEVVERVARVVMVAGMAGESGEGEEKGEKVRCCEKVICGGCERLHPRLIQSLFVAIQVRSHLRGCHAGQEGV